MFVLCFFARNKSVSLVTLMVVGLALLGTANPTCSTGESTFQNDDAVRNFVACC